MPKILTIDDDKITHRFVSRALKEDFELLDAFDGKEGIEVALASSPDVILLDVEMPGMNGYEVCDKLKHNDITRDIPIVFLSGNSSLEGRMHGYEVGGSDYLVKPFEVDTLKAKTRVLIELHDSQTQLNKQIEDAKKTAQIAMTSTADLGLVLQFVEQCFQIADAERLAKSILGVAKNMNLNIILQITTMDQPQWFSTNSQVTPLEIEVMTMLKNKRHNDFGTRTVVNYPNISLMVKNMPIDDPERYGRIKDLIPAILSSANGKVDNINTNLMVEQQTLDIINTFDQMNDSLGSLFTQNNANRAQIEEILLKMFGELQAKVPYMGLEDDQEEYILGRVDHSIVQVTQTNDQAKEIISSIQQILGDLEALAASQRVLSESISAKKSSQTIDEDDDDDGMAVQLF
ncbi:MAG: response regulator [Pseudomonadales bacterium]|nr:response regulator [Pseudomonadales bacterium]